MKIFMKRKNADKGLKSLWDKVLIDCIKTLLVVSCGIIITYIVAPAELSMKLLIPLYSVALVLFLMLLFYIILLLLKRQTFSRKAQRAGIVNFIFERNELLREYSIGNILRDIKPHTELFVAARSASAWASEFATLAKAVEEKDIRVTMTIADPNLRKDSLPIKDDWALDDLRGSFDKFAKMRLTKAHLSSVRIYLVPTFLLCSFVCFVNADDEEIGIYEFGADLPLDRRLAIICREGDLLSNLKDIHRKLLAGRNAVDLQLNPLSSSC
jgi:hypothetical protein